MKKIIEKLKDKGCVRFNFIWLFIWIGFVIIILCQIYNILKFNIISPLEIREGVGFKYAKDFAQGHNPYSVQILNDNKSPVINHYGLVMPLFLSLFIKIAPNHMIFVIRFVTLVVRLFGCYCFYKGIEFKTNKKWLSMLSVFFIYALYQYPSYPCVWALTLSFLLYWLISEDTYRNKPRIYLYILIIILLFYTKQYFVMLSLGVFTHLLFCHYKRQAFKFAFLGIGFGSISILIINLIFPLYFTQALLFVGTASSSSNSISHMKEQFGNMIYNFFNGMFILLIATILFIICNLYKNKLRENENKFKTSILYSIIQFFCMVPVLVVMAKNTGATNEYFFQLWIPYLIDIAICFVGYCIDELQFKNIYEISKLLILSTVTSIMFF